jgi:hypothetical protein
MAVMMRQGLPLQKHFGSERPGISASLCPDVSIRYVQGRKPVLKPEETLRGFLVSPDRRSKFPQKSPTLP